MTKSINEVYLTKAVELLNKILFKFDLGSAEYGLISSSIELINAVDLEKK